MTKDERIQGFVAEYLKICRKYNLVVSGCFTCREMFLMPADVTVYSVTDLPTMKVFDFLNATEKHTLPGDWARTSNAPQATDGPELPDTQVQDG